TPKSGHRLQVIQFRERSAATSAISARAMRPGRLAGSRTIQELRDIVDVPLAAFASPLIWWHVELSFNCSANQIPKPIIKLLTVTVPSSAGGTHSLPSSVSWVTGGFAAQDYAVKRFCPQKAHMWGPT